MLCRGRQRSLLFPARSSQAAAPAGSFGALAGASGYQTPTGIQYPTVGNGEHSGGDRTPDRGPHLTAP